MCVMAVRWTSRRALSLSGRLRHAPGHAGILSSISSTSNHSVLDHASICSPRFRAFSTALRRHNAKLIVRVPQMAESITEGTLSQFSKQIGDYIEADEELATIETDKIDVSVNAPQAGIIRQLFVAEGDVVNVNQGIAEIQPGKQETTAQNAKEQSIPLERTGEEGSKLQSETTVSASSAALDKVSLECPEKRSEEASQKTATQKIEKSAADASVAGQFSPSRGLEPSRLEQRVKMTRIRKRTAQRLKESQDTAAFLTTFNEVDMSRLIELRINNKEAVMEKHGIKLGFMGFMARASALALKEIPAVNASIENNDTIVYRDYVDLSIAASIPKGLVTPVVRNIESMNVLQIEKAIAEMVNKARDGKLNMDDLTGGNFTISNSGVWGSLFGTPIINLPQTAVLGTYGTMDRPVAVNGQVEIRPMMYVALTYDHRLIDGREAVQFLVLIKTYLENPESMMLQV